MCPILQARSFQLERRASIHPAREANELGIPRSGASPVETTMMTAKTVVLSGVCAFLIGACGSPGLPPAGPAPGQVDVGRGTQPEGKVTGAVTTVESEKIGRSAPYRIEELLKGKLSGVQVITKPNGDYAFRVRGGNTTLMEGETSQDALVVVDGVPT